MENGGGNEQGLLPSDETAPRASKSTLRTDTSAHTVVVGVFLIFIVSAGAFAFLFASQKLQRGDREDAPAAKELLSSDRKNPNNFLRYYETTFRPSRLIVKQFNLDSPVLSKELFQLEGRYYVVGPSWNSEHSLLITGQTLLDLDTGSGVVEEIFSIDESEGRLMDATLSQSREYIAYSVDTEPAKFKGKKAEVWIYNATTKEKKKIFDGVLSLYAGLEVLGWNDTDEHIVLKEIGVDAGAVWGKVFTVGTKLPYVVTIPEVDSYNFILGKLSPDGNSWLYRECDNPSDGSGENIFGTTCDEGEQLKVYSFLTKETRSVYRNLTHNNNSHKGSYRVIFDFSWLDNESAVIAIPDGIYKLVVPTGLFTVLYDTSNLFHPTDNADDTITLLRVSKAFVVFKYGYRIAFILDAESGRATVFGEKGADRVIEGYFFEPPFKPTKG